MNLKELARKAISTLFFKGGKTKCDKLSYST